MELEYYKEGKWCKSLGDQQLFRIRIEDEFNKFNVAQVLKDIFFDGYDYFEDYRKYSNAFLLINPKE